MDSKKLEELSRKFIERAESPEPKVTNWGGSALGNAYLSRDISENLLADNVLKNTGIPIPSKYVTTSKFEDFLNRIMQERYPELSPDVNLKDLSKDEAKGLYWRGQSIPSWIEIEKNLKKNPIEAVGTMLHEAGHQYDHKILNRGIGSEIRDELVNILDDRNPQYIYEQIAKGHHAEIPDLREGSFGKGALKSFLKSGTFRQAAGALPLVGGLAAAGMSEDASAAVPILGEAGPVGESVSDEFRELAEDKARKDYNKSPAKMDKLKKLMSR